MAECFCGCGRKVGITSRGMNKQGRRTVGLLAKLREAREKLDRDEGAANPVFLFDFAVHEGADERDPDSISRKMGEQLDELIEEGEEYEQIWINAVHGYVPPPSEAREAKRRGRRGARPE
jgi:hypothetical protein